MLGYKNDNNTGRLTHEGVPLENVVVYDPLGTNKRNTYLTLAEAVNAIKDVKGERILRIMPSGTSTWPAVTVDAYGLRILANVLDQPDLVFPIGAVAVQQSIFFSSNPLVIIKGDVFTMEVLEADPLAMDGVIELVVLG